jgi:T-box protein 2
MFPAFQVKVTGLDPDSKYMIFMDIVQKSEHRYKFHNGHWMMAGKADQEPPHEIYVHPDSPTSGKHWMDKTISFKKLKLTNNASERQHTVSLKDYNLISMNGFCI